MDLYTYVASSNPYQARAILHKYGYSVKDVNTSGDLGICLKKLVAYEGEDAFNDVLESHPDKGVILEKFSKSEDSQTCKNGNCNCQSCRSRELQYMNFNGSGDDKGSKSIKEVSVFILASALLLAAAIIVKK